MKYSLILITLISFLLVSCGGLRVDYDYDKEVDFSAYKTYNYYADMNTGLSDLDTKRLLKVVDSTLQARGMQLSETPDFVINIQSEVYEGAQNSSVGVGAGGTGRNVGGGVSVGIPIGSRLQREILFDFVDERKSGLFWQAISNGPYSEKASPEKREARFRAVVAKVFAGYPPANK